MQHTSIPTCNCAADEHAPSSGQKRGTEEGRKPEGKRDEQNKMNVDSDKIEFNVIDSNGTTKHFHRQTTEKVPAWTTMQWSPAPCIVRLKCWALEVHLETETAVTCWAFNPRTEWQCRTQPASVKNCKASGTAPPAWTMMLHHETGIPTKTV